MSPGVTRQEQGIRGDRMFEYNGWNQANHKILCLLLSHLIQTLSAIFERKNVGERIWRKRKGAKSL